MTPIRKRYLSQFLILLVLLICSIVFLLFILSNQINNTLENSYYKKLNVTKNTLKENITTYFRNKSDLISSLSENQCVNDSIIEFSNSFQQLENEYEKTIENNKVENFINEHIKKVIYGVPYSTSAQRTKDYIPKSKNGVILQSLYIFDNSFKVGEKEKLLNSNNNLTYDVVHEKFHQKFVNILKRHKFYDIFLIDNNGNIVYSVFKELDLGTNLNSGVYSKSSLASAYKKALKTDSTSFSDFRPYEPSYNEPAAFFAIPVRDGDKTLGVMALQISIDEINNIVTFNSNWEEIGLGKSGEAYLVGDDYFMRSDSRFKSNINNTNVKKLDTTIGVLNIESNLVRNALTGKDDQGEFVDYRGVNVLSSFTSLNVFDNVWALIIEIDSDEVNKEINETIFFIMTVCVFIILLFMAVLWFLVVKIIIKPIENFENKLAIRVKEQTKELKELNKNLNDQVEKQIIQLRQKDKILLHQNRMAAIGEMMNNIAHQWRQPLSIITLNSSTMEMEIELGENISQEKNKEHLKTINKQAEYLSQTIDDFLSFYNSDSSRTKEISLINILERTEELVMDSFKENKIQYYIESVEDIYLDANENQLIQVFLNIFNNCKDALVLNEEVHRFVFVSLLTQDNNVVIKIKDSGGGIKDEVKEKLFDPYTTTKHSYIGTGIGLYMSYELITKVYSGTISVKDIEYEFNNEKLKGAEFTIKLPLETE